MRQRRSQLLSEAAVYKLLQGVPGIPRLVWVGTEAGRNIMVMELLGSSLESLMQSSGKRLALSTVLILAEQMVSPKGFIKGRSRE